MKSPALTIFPKSRAGQENAKPEGRQRGEFPARGMCSLDPCRVTNAPSLGSFERLLRARLDSAVTRREFWPPLVLRLSSPNPLEKSELARRRPVACHVEATLDIDRSRHDCDPGPRGAGGQCAKGAAQHGSPIPRFRAVLCGCAAFFVGSVLATGAFAVSTRAGQARVSFGRSAEGSGLRSCDGSVSSLRQAFESNGESQTYYVEAIGFRASSHLVPDSIARWAG
jgi:hypothetical protein